MSTSLRPAGQAFFTWHTPVLVSARWPEAAQGFAWSGDAGHLLSRGEPFVWLQAASLPEPDSLPLVRAWFRARARALQTCCKGLIVVEPDLGQRLASRAAFESLSAHALRVLVISKASLVHELAPVLLSQGAGMAVGDATLRPTRTRRN